MNRGVKWLAMFNFW